MDWATLAAQLLLAASILSVVTLLASLVVVPWVVTRLPADYFVKPRRTPWRLRADRPVLSVLVVVVKNILGALLVALGVIMLVTPGQGLLTLLMGLLLVNFPGKYRLMRLIVRRPGVIGALNWLRERAGHAPFDPVEG